MSKEIEALYAILAELRKLDERIATLQGTADRIPGEIATLDSEFHSIRTQYETSKSKIDELKKRLRETEGEIRDREDKIRKSQDRMMEVKTNEEYQAASKEIQAQQGDKTKNEDRALTLMGELEGITTAFRSTELEFQGKEKEFQTKRKALEAEREKFLAEAQTIRDERNGVATKLNAESSTIYARLSRPSSQVRMNPIAEVVRGICTACRMAIRPQLYNEILGHAGIRQCPSCSRLLVLPPQAPVAEAASS